MTCVYARGVLSVCVYLCVCACVRVYVRLCVCACVRACDRYYSVSRTDGMHVGYLAFAHNDICCLFQHRRPDLFKGNHIEMLINVDSVGEPDRPRIPTDAVLSLVVLTATCDRNRTHSRRRTFPLFAARLAC